MNKLITGLFLSIILIPSANTRSYYYNDQDNMTDVITKHWLVIEGGSINRGIALDLRFACTKTGHTYFLRFSQNSRGIFLNYSNKILKNRDTWLRLDKNKPVKINSNIKVVSGPGYSWTIQVGYLFPRRAVKFLNVMLSSNGLLVRTFPFTDSYQKAEISVAITGDRKNIQKFISKCKELK